MRQCPKKLRFTGLDVARCHHGSGVPPSPKIRANYTVHTLVDYESVYSYISIESIRVDCSASTPRQDWSPGRRHYLCDRDRRLTNSANTLAAPLNSRRWPVELHGFCRLDSCQREVGSS
jgi:hypothetical protein